MGGSIENSLFDNVISVTLSAAFPLLVMLSCNEPAEDTISTSPKFRESGEREINAVGVVPVPLSSTVAVGRFEALLSTVRVPCTGPVEVGVNVTVTVVESPAGT